MKLATQQGEHARSPRIIFRESSRGGLERLHTLSVNGADLTGVSAAVGEHGSPQAIGVAELLRERCGVEERLPELRVPDLALGLPEADQEL